MAENGNGNSEDFDLEEYLAEGQKKIDEALEASAADQAERDQETEELAEQFQKAQEEADARAEEQAIKDEADRQAGRVTRPHEQFLQENGLDHIRQDNDGPEDYSDLPENIHVETPETDDTDRAPETQETEPPVYETVMAPPTPLYSVSFPQ